MELSYDETKRSETLVHRGLDFARAAEVFSGLTFTQDDAREDYGERRRITVGLLDQRMVVLVWTQRNGTRRIISMRKANEREQIRYRDRLGRP